MIPLERSSVFIAGRGRDLSHAKAPGKWTDAGASIVVSAMLGRAREARYARTRKEGTTAVRLDICSRFKKGGMALMSGLKPHV